jgi:hypothetical protein
LLKATLLLAEAATAHPDGTISMLRAGITNVWGEKPPVNLQASLVSRILAELGDSGDHQFDLRCMDEDGKEIMPRLHGTFQVPAGGGHSNLILNFGIGFTRHGRHMFVLRIDNVQYDTWTVTAAPPPQATPGQSPPQAPPPNRA